MGIIDSAVGAVGKMASGAVGAVTGAIFKGMPENKNTTGQCPGTVDHPLFGYVRWEGREYQYTYRAPTNEEITKLAESWGQSHPNLTARACRHYAHHNILHKNMLEAETKAFELLRRMNDEMFKNMRLDETESGISQRREADIFLDSFASEYGLELKPVSFQRHKKGTEQSRKTIKKDDADQYPLNLMNELNTMLAEKKARREKDIQVQFPYTGTIKGDQRTVDLAFHQPEGKSYQEQFHALAAYAGGFGQVDAQETMEMVKLNRFAKNLVAGTRELVGFTFITRPHLNLSNANIAAVRSFAPLLMAPAHSTQMMIKLLLDSEMQHSELYKDKIECDKFDECNPFLVPLCNALQSISGFPDPNLATETTEGGFFSESQTCVIGYDRLAKGYDLQLQFRDYPGGPILAMHDYWYQYMGLLMDGTLVQYNDDIEHNLMGYTSSIYRFVMDPTCRQIVRWSKATGCFPRMAPVGAPFNYGQGEHVVTAAREFSVPYFAHHIGYNDPIILQEFNMLVRRYATWLSIEEGDPTQTGRMAIDHLPASQMIIRGDIANNRAGIPYITQENGFNELVWLLPSYEARGHIAPQMQAPTKTPLELDAEAAAEANVNSQFGSPASAPLVHGTTKKRAGTAVTAKEKDDMDKLLDTVSSAANKVASTASNIYDKATGFFA